MVLYRVRDADETHVRRGEEKIVDGAADQVATCWWGMPAR